MKHSRLFVFLLLPVALLALLILAGIMAAVLAFAPGHISAAALAILGVVAVWAIFGRHKSGALVPGSETALVGRQSSKDGLL